MKDQEERDRDFLGIELARSRLILRRTTFCRSRKSWKKGLTRILFLAFQPCISTGQLCFARDLIHLVFGYDTGAFVAIAGLFFGDVLLLVFYFVLGDFLMAHISVRDENPRLVHRGLDGVEGRGARTQGQRPRKYRHLQR